MENAVQALKMAAAALIFVIAIATSFYMFGIAKDTADAIIGMRNKQGYLESASVDGILFTTSTTTENVDGTLAGTLTSSVTNNGDRVVQPDDVISTIYRYAAEKYAVTIIEQISGDWKVTARFDSSIESIIQNNSTDITDDGWEYLARQIKHNLQNKYHVPTTFGKNELTALYEVEYYGGIYTRTDAGAPWLANNYEIQRRVNADISGTEYENESVKQRYQGKDILNKVNTAIEIIEVLNEIDESKYKLDGANSTGLVEEYQMPTVEVIYIIKR